MIDILNGYHYKNLINCGLMNLILHCDEVNELNVFPVPDGDTGTNMVNTLQNGYKAIEGKTGELSELSKLFAKAVTFGARGNSGVIVSQFFYGFSKCFFYTDSADCSCFVDAVASGTEYAYKSVSHPVEGTVLTVLRESSEYISTKNRLGINSIDEIIGLFLEKARISLNNTPNLLPVLKSAGVCDSGAAGIVYFFEGIYKYINGEDIVNEDSVSLSDSFVDYSFFNKKSVFNEGYCTEFLLQLTDSAELLEKECFLSELDKLGSSVVTVFEDDKVKVHVHTGYPEHVMTYAHRFGEFLSLKIENMSVQNYQIKRHENVSEVEICCGEKIAAFSFIAVTSDEQMKELFMSMGADIVIYSKEHIQPAVTDYLEAFKLSGAKSIFVFPNSKNSTLAALKAKELYGNNVIIFDTKSEADCYAALSMIDFDEDNADALTESITDVIENIYSVKILRAAKSSKFDEIEIHFGDFIGVCGDEVLSCSGNFAECFTKVIDSVSERKECDAVTVFAGKGSSDDIAGAVGYIQQNFSGIETDIVETNSENFVALISFE